MLPLAGLSACLYFISSLVMTTHQDRLFPVAVKPKNASSDFKLNQASTMSQTSPLCRLPLMCSAPAAKYLLSSGAEAAFQPSERDGGEERSFDSQIVLNSVHLGFSVVVASAD